MRSVVEVAVDMAAVKGVCYRKGAVVICYSTVTENAVAVRARYMPAAQVVYYCLVAYDGRVMFGGDFFPSRTDSPLMDDS